MGRLPGAATPVRRHLPWSRVKFHIQHDQSVVSSQQDVRHRPLVQSLNCIHQSLLDSMRPLQHNFDDTRVRAAAASEFGQPFTGLSARWC